MNRTAARLIVFSAITLAAASAVQAQMVQDRRATFRGAPRPDGGKCTIEVDVDDVAQVEITGDSGRIRTLSGQPALWRRFECTGPMPQNVGDFRFTGVDGRGRQVLVSDPRNNRGVAVVRIEDPRGGREGYTFDIEWRGGPPPEPPRGGDFGRDDRDRNRDGDRLEASRAIAMCQDAVRDRAARDYMIRDMEFGRVAFDDNPARRDWVVGNFFARSRFGRDQYNFSCAVDFDGRRLRDVQIRPR